MTLHLPISRKKSGFTLIELLVVMALIAIIAGAAWGNFFNSLAKGRDTKRKTDLDSISKALELYYNDERSYPTVLPDWGTPLTSSTDTSVVYMQKIPNDPAAPQISYCYESDSNGSFFKLYANMENRDDQRVFPTPIFCQGIYYNYGVSSPNTTP